MTGTLKNNFIVFLTIFSFSTACLADCEDWTGIKKNTDNTYTYSEKLHLCVGQVVQDNKTKDQQVSDLNKAIELKDLALKTSDDRATLWMGTSQKLEDRVQKLDSLESGNKLLYFGLGVATTFLAGFMAAKLINK